MSDPKIILIVDDSKVSRMMIKAIIKDLYPEWTILEAANTDEAIECSTNNPIDFYSVDLNMPGKDGLELIAILKPKKSDAMFALLTANIQPHVRNSAKELGAECFNKPITNTSVGEMLSYFHG